MSANDKNNADQFSQYLLSSKLEELEKITSNLFAELQDSKKVMADICSLMNSIPREQANRTQQSNGLRHEDISQFLAAPTPNLLMPDMSQINVDLDLDKMIAEMKQYAENIKNNIVHTEAQQEHASRPIEAVDWEECAISMDKFRKRITNIKLVKSTGANRNMELEAKMEELCRDVNLFTQMVQAKTTLSESNSNLIETEQDDRVLLYEDLINKILLSTNELSYLLKNKN